MQGEVTHGLNAPVPQVPAELYASLRRLAQHHLLRQQASPTLSATGLVHDAWLKLAAGDPVWQNRQHFVATMAKVMRQVLVDHARTRQAERHGGDLQRVTYDGVDSASDEQFELSDLVAIDQALDRLRAFDPRLEQVFELRFFAGLTIDEAAEALSLSAPTVKRDLRAARAFVVTQLQSRA